MPALRINETLNDIPIKFKLAELCEGAVGERRLEGRAYRSSETARARGRFPFSKPRSLTVREFKSN